MRREYYPLEIRTVEPRRSLISTLLGTTIKIKINTIIAIIAAIIYIALIISIPTTPGESYYFENITFYVGGRPGPYPLSLGPIPVYKHLLNFKPIFHTCYWIATIGFIIAGSGMIFRNGKESARAIKLYYIGNTAIIVTGVIKVSSMLIAQYYNCFLSNIILTLFLIGVPLIITLPLQILLRRNGTSYKEWLETKQEKGKKATIGAITTIGFLGAISILIAISYVGIEKII
ncbi:MAG: hypothetical protein JXA54_15510 [Candidatus Heimdallarchaeota archaeon]|nr:hypothetical protein [Candidatus Heimdallarchaeota archaeon]